ncbi:MAG: hypothetical protein H6582_11415 [Crocinitomicaceae bacterium]|nr:hypothetical protein [Crocinitomicaceae bacterium]
MKKTFTLILLLGFFMNSCYFLNDILDPPKPKEPTFQEKCEKAVSEYIKTTVPGTYKPYGFGAITIHKPIEIVDLERMEKENEEKPSYKLQKKIERQKKIIKRENIERTVDLDHFFTIKDANSKVKVFETNFLLNDTLGMKDLSAKIILELPTGYDEILDYFFFEYNIFLTHSFVESRELSANFYAFFKKELETQQNMLDKSDFLLHCLKLTKAIKDRGAFDQQGITQVIAQEHITTARKDIMDYNSLQFSPLYENSDENSNSLKGYYFFHKFIGNYSGTQDTNVVLIEFSPYYQIQNIYQMDRPFEQYFNK